MSDGTRGPDFPWFPWVALMLAEAGGEIRVSLSAMANAKSPDDVEIWSYLDAETGSHVFKLRDRAKDPGA